MTRRAPEDLRILVVGDVMLDEYLLAVPMAEGAHFRGIGRSRTPGGAAFVARQCATYGCETRLVGRVGDDEAGAMLAEDLGRLGVRAHFAVSETRTTVKTRVMGPDGYEHLRLSEDGIVWDDDVERLALEHRDFDAVILSDYGKGALPRPSVLAALGSATTPIVIDPCPHERREAAPEPSWTGYREMTLLTPNEHEWVSWERAHRGEGTPGPMLVTMGGGGARLLAGGEAPHIRTVPSSAACPIGAGDVVAASVAIALAAGLPLAGAARAAVCAATAATREIGTTPCAAKDFAAFIEAPGREEG